MKEIIRPFLIITAGACLLFIGGKLRDRFASSDLTLTCKVSYKTVNELNIIDFTLTNSTTFAFDSVKISPDYTNIITTSYSSKNSINLSVENRNWISTLLPNDIITGIIVFTSINRNESPHNFIEKISASRKNPKTYQWEKIKIESTRNQRFKLFKQDWFWFFIPYLSVGVILLIINIIIKRKKKPNS